MAGRSDVIIIGAGRVGSALAERSRERGIACAVVTRDEGWEALDGPPGHPVMLAVRNDDMLEVVARVPVQRRDDLVFVQNGMIRGFLRENALERCTRGLLYFAVARRGDPITPGGINPFCGPHGLAMSRWFVELGLEARDLDWARFSYYELEKLAWLAILGALCERHDATVGVVATAHRDELERMADELRRVGRAAIGVDAPLDHLVGRLVEYSLRIPEFRASVKEWRWRNGWVDHAARRHSVDTPFHRQVMREIGKGQLLEQPESR